MNVLVLNCGSSSVRFQIIETDLDLMARDADRMLAAGYLDRIGGRSEATFRAAGRPPLRREIPLPDYGAAIAALLDWLVSSEADLPEIRSHADIHAAGHRVVHGGERFSASVRITPEVLAGIEECALLAPLHNPANIEGIRVMMRLLGPASPQAAVFDTAFHATMPAVSYLYGIPYEIYEKHKVRRYGFHGTSHRYVALRYGSIRGLPRESVNIITLHLGNGCSACAVQHGESLDTSMGFTPLEGLLMGTRCGDLDASVPGFLAEREGITPGEVSRLLNSRSGLLGVSGLTADMRDLLEAEQKGGSSRAGLAIEIFCARARKYVGAYYAEMAGCDAVVFTGGIGENSPAIRRRICRGLDKLGLRLEESRNLRVTGGAEGVISTADSSLAAFVIPTNEELLIARDTVRAVLDRPQAV